MSGCEVCGAPCPRQYPDGPKPKRCVECKAHDRRPNAKTRAEHNREYRERNRERLRAAARARYRSDPDRFRREASEYRARVGAAEYAARQRARNYGITPEEFDAMVAAQGGRCAICGADRPGGRGGWHLDHDHTFSPKDRRGHRGVLCHGCNVGIGTLGDDPDRLEAAARYLRGRAA